MLLPTENKLMTNKLHVLRIETLLHVSAAVFSHLQGMSILKDVYSFVLQLCYRAMIHVGGKICNDR